MENATKALLIAGSILITLLVIAFGLKIFNSTKGTTEATKATMDATELAIFYSKFNQYIGVKRGVELKTSLGDVISSNNSTYTERKILLHIKGIGPRELYAIKPGEVNDTINNWITADQKFRVTIDKTPGTMNGTNYFAKITIEPSNN